VYSKSEYTLESVSVSGRPSVYTITLHNYIRLSWNFVHRIVSSISREREEDEKDLSRNGWVIEKIVIIDPTIPEGGTGIFFQKKYFSQNYLKHIWIDSVFKADSEYDIRFESNRSFLTKSCLKKVSNTQKLCPETNVPRYVSGDWLFGGFLDAWLCSY
jgi:hypothetical protein